MIVNRFEEGQTIMQEGEVGTWFGILLSGTLRAEGSSPGQLRYIRRGALLGEMSMFQPVGAEHSATVCGNEAGMIGAMLMSQIGAFQGECPAVMIKLMRVMAKSGLGKELSNLRASRSRRLGAAALASPTSRCLPTEANTARLQWLLSAKGLDTQEVSTVMGAVEYFSVHIGQELLKSGQPFPYVLFILSGSLTYERWGYDLVLPTNSNKLRMVGAPAFFGEFLLTDASSIMMTSSGQLAGIPFEKLEALLQNNAHLGCKLMMLLGQSAIRLCTNIDISQRCIISSESGSLTLAEEYVFSIPFLGDRSGTGNRGSRRGSRDSVRSDPSTGSLKPTNILDLGSWHKAETFYKAKLEEQATSLLSGEPRDEDINSLRMFKARCGSASDLPTLATCPLVTLPRTRRLSTCLRLASRCLISPPSLRDIGAFTPTFPALSSSLDLDVTPHRRCIGSPSRSYTHSRPT